MSRTYIVFAIPTLLTLLVSGSAKADPSEHEATPPPVHDYSRFSDGPRQVPTPRGASMVRAEALGLGTRATASRLLHGTPDPEWVRAADWRGRNVSRLLWPVDEGRYVRGFGFVRQTRPDLRHDGVDISATPGTPVRAAADGIVAYSDNGIRGFGNCVILIHPNGWVTLYAHNQRTTVQPGWRVQRGERIALLGNTGISRGPHVHFELHDRGPERDPLALFDGGPPIVQRAAERAAEAGSVPAPSSPDAEDRRAPTPLAEAVATSDAPLTRELGTRTLLRRLRNFRPTDELIQTVSGRRFSDLLWPVREAPSLDAPDAHPVRAAMDGRVVYAGLDGARGRTIALLHPSGWVTVYAGLGAIHVELGDQVERGQWIGRTRQGGRGLDFDLRVDGRRADPEPLFRNRPR